jgi:hypothetical protein
MNPKAQSTIMMLAIKTHVGELGGAGRNASWQPPINIREKERESTPLQWPDNRPEVD